MKRKLKITLLLLLIVLIGLQFVRPQKNIDGYASVSLFESETKPNTDVVAVLKNNCYELS